MKYAVLVLVLLVGLGAAFVGRSLIPPSHATPLATPTQVATWWTELTQCSGAKVSPDGYKRIRWYAVESFSDKTQAGQWIPSHRIYLSRMMSNYEEVNAKHEILHDMLGITIPAHPAEFERCEL